MRVVSLFSGAGGLDLGLQWAGHRILWANDNDHDSVQTYRRNIGPHIFEGDIKSIPSADIPKADLVVGGFPCQGFSVANIKRHREDQRNFLYLELLRVIREKQPKYFLAENVKGILYLDNGNILNIILTDFKNEGYRVTHRVLNAADFGVPQRRERVFFLGVRDDIRKILSFPVPTHYDPHSQQDLVACGLKPWVAVGEALSSIPEPEAAPEMPNHTYSKYKLRFNGYLGHRTVDPDRPAPTVTARGDPNGGVVVLHHPSNLRRMSVRELASVQSFPLDFVFCGTQSSAYRQVGNAVPPLLAKAIGTSLAKE